MLRWPIIFRYIYMSCKSFADSLFVSLVRCSVFESNFFILSEFLNYFVYKNITEVVSLRRIRNSALTQGVSYVQYLLKTTGRFLACVIDFLAFFVKCKTVKCNFRFFLSKKYKKKKWIIFQFSFCNLHCPKSFRYVFI